MEVSQVTEMNSEGQAYQETTTRHRTITMDQLVDNSGTAIFSPDSEQGGSFFEQ
jgi:hypothetical protein